MEESKEKSIKDYKCPSLIGCHPIDLEPFKLYEMSNPVNDFSTLI